MFKQVMKDDVWGERNAAAQIALAVAGCTIAMAIVGGVLKWLFGGTFAAGGMAIVGLIYLAMYLGHVWSSVDWRGPDESDAEAPEQWQPASPRNRPSSPLVADRKQHALH